MQNLSHKITDFLLQKNVIALEEREIYVYGFEAMLTGFLQTSVILLIGWLGGFFWQTIIYFVVVKSVREYTGGYHAETKLGCWGITIVVYLLSMVIDVYCGFVFRMWFVTVSILFFIVYCLRYIPVAHPNKEMDEDRRQICRKKGIAISIFWILCSLIFYEIQFQISVCIWSAMLVVCFAILCGECKNIFGR